MSSLFANTHNVVAILEKSDAAEGFKQIIDFLSGSYIHYALTVNPHIYISCIKQFWNTAAVKRLRDVTRLQALVDKKKIVISEVVICEILQLNDAEGVSMEVLGSYYSSILSAKRTSWNEFSTAMASAVICLSKGQKFNFSKYIFDSLVRNVDSSSKFYMVGKGFSGVETPLFEGMLTVGQPAEEKLVDDQIQIDNVVAAAVDENVAENVSQAAIPSPLPHDIPSPLQAPSLPPQQQHSSPQALPQDAKFPTQLQQLEIIQLKARVKKLEKANKIKSSKLRRLRKVGASKRVESSDGMKDVFNQGRMIADMDMNEGIELVKDAEVAESEGRHAEKQAETYNLDLDHSSKVLISTASTTIPAASATIPATKPTIPAVAATVVAAYTRRRKGVIIRDPEEELPLKTPAETPVVKNKGKGILVETPKPMKKKD
nr:xylulose kinase-1 [Tanacetum cinerariifolium]